MKIEQIREALQGEPFRPFDIHVKNGRHYHVPEPKYVYFVPVGQRLVIFDADGGVNLIDHDQLIEVKTAT